MSDNKIYSHPEGLGEVYESISQGRKCRIFHIVNNKDKEEDNIITGPTAGYRSPLIRVFREMKQAVDRLRKGKVICEKC